MRTGDVVYTMWSLVVVGLLAGGLSVHGETAEDLVAGGVLSGTDNPALIDFLLREGKGKPTPELHGKALDQAVASLRARANVTPEEQLAAALSSAIGMAMQVADDDIVSGAGADVESSTYTGEWGNWVDAAEMLLEAGYTEDAVAFFQYGMETLPYPDLRNRCVMGLVKANPDEAYDRLMKMTEQPNIDLQNAALRSLGLLAGSGGLSDEQKDAVMALLIEKSQGLMNASYTLAAIRGLDYARDERAIAPLSKYKGGMMVTEENQRPALRSLLLTYEDDIAMEPLLKMIKGGMMSTHDAWDRMFAGRLLMQAGKQEGFDWALKELTPKKKSFLSTKKDEPDLRYDVISTLTWVGGDAALEVLGKAYGHRKQSELMQASIAIALLVLGDDTHIETVRAAMGREGWDFTAANAALALAGHGDLSGIPVLDRLAAQEPKKDSAGMSALKLLSGKSVGNAGEKNRIIRLRRRIANTLGKIDRPEGVATLTRLLEDRDPNVRSSAAYALMGMDDPAAVQGLQAAMGVDYGVTAEKKSRNPVIHGTILRTAMAKHAGEDGAAALVQAATTAKDPTIRFMALVGP